CEITGQGDEKMVRRAMTIHEHGGHHAQRFPGVRHAAQIAVRMLREGLDAFARLDAGAAAEVLKEDSAMAQEFTSVRRQLITYMMEAPRTITPALEIVWVA